MSASGRRPRVWAAFAAGCLWACSEAPLVAGAPVEGLVFVRAVDGSTEVMRARLSDGAVRPLTRTADRTESWPYWSQTAGLLVFQARAQGAETQTDLVLWDPRTGDERPLVPASTRDERWPGWSPDGRRLVYAFRGGRPPAGVAIANVAAGRARVVAASGPRDFFLRPNFDPAGERLVAQRRGSDGRGSQLWILAKRAPPRPLTREAAGGPHDVVSVASDGSDLRVHAGDPRADDHSARPSPTRDEFAFVSDRAGSFDVFVADLADGQARRITDTPDVNEFAPRWSPDGERLVVIVNDASAGAPRLDDPESLAAIHLRALDRDGRVLFEAPGYNPDWMPPWP
jgi:Tol biopolymer transport system component